MRTRHDTTTADVSEPRVGAESVEQILRSVR